MNLMCKMSLIQKRICFWSVWCFIFMGRCVMNVFPVRSQLVQVNSCTLLEQEIIAYQCTVCGEGATVWNGSLFDCTSDEIILSHRLFEYGSASGARGECNNGAVSALSIGVLRENNTNYYISQLNISMNAAINNKTVTCLHISCPNATVVDTTDIGYIYAVMVSSPNNIRLIDVKTNRLTFTWNDSVNLQQTHTFSDTDSIVYNIIASNCGTCPNSTSSLSAIYTCVDFIADGRVCSFALQAVVCAMGNRFSPISDPVKIQIKVLDAPVVDAKVEALSYSSLIYSIFNESDPVNISNEIDGSALSYSISYYDSTFSILCGSAIIRPSSCINGTCRHVFDLALSSCIMGTKFILTVVATNVFGDSPVSNYSVSVIDADEKINRYVSGENDLQTWIASSSLLGSLLLLTLTLSIVLSIVTVVSIRSKKRMQRETQQIHGDGDQAEAKVIYEEVVLTPQPVPPTVIHTEENIAYANISGNK